MISKMTFAGKSYLFAQLANIAYLPEEEAKTEAGKLGFTTVEFYNKSGAQAYRFQNADDLVIACRGTQPTQFNDIAADLKAFPVPSETISRVHRGFKAEVDELWPMILEDITRKVNTDNKLWFCGHSLGAAMATIMASRCYYEASIQDPIELYTYGSPRVGWPKYVKALGVTHHRWRNNNDIVTTVPLAVMGYRHDGTEHYINAYGNVRDATTWQKFKDKLRGMWMGIKQGKIDSFSDHSMTQYCAFLKNYAEGRQNPQ